MSDFEVLPIGTAERIATLEAQIRTLQSILLETAEMLRGLAGTGPRPAPIAREQRDAA